MGILRIPNTDGDFAGNEWKLYCDLFLYLGLSQHGEKPKFWQFYTGHHGAVMVNHEIIFVGIRYHTWQRTFFVFMQVRLVENYISGVSNRGHFHFGVVNSQYH